MKPLETELCLQTCLERYRRRGGRAALAAVATVDSTNRLARRIARVYLASDRPVPRLALLARGQSAGRGRRDRVWRSPPGQGIYTSLLLSVADAEALAALPLAVPLALCTALDRVGAACAIKWPNDLVVGGRKLGGILIESLAGARAVIVGYGINGNQREADLPVPEATSLRLVTGAALDLSRLAVDLAAGLLERLGGRPAEAGIVEAYRRRSAHRPGDRLVVWLDGERLAGCFDGFDDHGRLRLDTGDGVRTLSAVDLLGDEAGAAVDTRTKTAGTP